MTQFTRTRLISGRSENAGGAHIFRPDQVGVHKDGMMRNRARRRAANSSLICDAGACMTAVRSMARRFHRSAISRRQSSQSSRCSSASLLLLIIESSLKHESAISRKSLHCIRITLCLGQWVGKVTGSSPAARMKKSSPPLRCSCLSGWLITCGVACVRRCT